jgi:SRSO17 transposase
LIDRELYLPKEWMSDRGRCRWAGVPDEVSMATKPVLAQRMINRAVEGGVPFGWVTGDETYGVDTKLRMWMESEDIAHVMAVARNTTVVTMRLTKTRVDRVVAELAEDACAPLSCGNGARGPRIYDWAVTDIRPLRMVDRGYWLLARRSHADPTDIAYYICFGPTDTAVEELVRVAGSRWAIEESFQMAKRDRSGSLPGSWLPMMV